MNKNLFRLVYSRPRGMLVAVAETVSAGGKADAGQTRRRDATRHASRRLACFSLFPMRCVAFATLMTLGAVPVRVQAQVTGAGERAPSVVQAPNGLPQIDINTPSAAGVSQNTYSQFDVPRGGAILNNASVMTQTQQAGMINGNPNLGPGQSARIILNQVNSTAPSQLRGFLEVAGSRAEVIVANGSGIVVDGGGFINTTRGILTTGTPILDANGGLRGFQVTGGSIAVQGAGLNASNVDQVDLIARAVQANAAIYGNAMNVITGTNQVDHDTLSASAISSTGASPGVSIDVSALGGMYANRITLVGTEKGVGVSNAGEIAAQAGDLTLTSAGQLVQSGKLSASGNVGIDVGSVANSGTIYAKQSTTVRAADTVTNDGTLAAQRDLSVMASHLTSTGTLGAGVNGDGSVGSGGDLSVAASAQLDVGGLSVAGGNAMFTGGGLNLAGSETSANGDLTLIASIGDLNLAGATTRAAGHVTAQVVGALINDDGTLAGVQGVTLDAARLSNVAGKIASQAMLIARTSGQLTNLGGEIVSAGAMQLRGGAIANDRGTLQSGAALSLVGDSLDNTAGRITSLNGDGLTVTVTGALTNAIGTTATGSQGGVIGGNGAVTLAAERVANHGTVSAQTDLQVGTGSLDNSDGTLQAAGNATIDAGAQLTNHRGNIVAGQAASVSAATLDNSAGALQAMQLSLGATNLVNHAGTITQTGTTSMRVAVLGLLDNSAGGTLQTNSADLTLAPSTLDNHGGTITHAGAGTLTMNVGNGTGTLSNTGGKITSNGQVIALAGSLDNATGLITGQTGLTATLGGAVDNANGKLLSNTDLTLTSDTLANDDGEIGAGANETIRTGSLTNKGGAIVAPNLSLTTNATLNNSGGNVKANQLALSAADLLNHGGTITHYGASPMTIDVRHTLDNSAGGTIQSHAQDLTLAPALLNNSGGKILAAGTGRLTIAPGNGAGTLLNARGEIIAGGQLALNVGSLDNSEGMLAARGNATAKVSGDVNNTQGVVRSLASLSVIGGGALDNTNGRIQSGTDGDDSTLAVQVASIDNTRGLIGNLGTGDATIQGGTRVVNGAGAITGNGRVALGASTISNTLGGQLSGATVSIDADTLDNTGGGIGNLAGSRGDVAIKTVGALTNTRGQIGATNDLNVTAATLAGGGAYGAAHDVAVNVDGDFAMTPALKLAAGHELAITLPGTFTNDTRVEAVENLNITAGDIANSGTMMAGGTLTTHSNTLQNTGTLVGGDVSLNATSRLSNVGPTALIGATNSEGTLELLAPIIENRDDTTATDTQATAAIFGLGRVVLAGGKDASGNYTNAQLIRNQSALIQSTRDMALHANQVTNTRRQMQTSGFTSSVSADLLASLGISLSGRTGKINTRDPNAIGGAYPEPPGSGRWNSDYIYTSYTGVAEANTVTSISPKAQIISGANLNASSVDLFQNYWSAVSAAGDIAAPVTLDQNSWKGQNAPVIRVTYSGHYHYDNYDKSIRDWQLPFGDANYPTYRPTGWNRSPADIRTYTSPAYESTFVANGKLTGSGVSIDNTAGNAGVPSIGLVPGQSVTDVTIGVVGGNANGTRIDGTSIQTSVVQFDPIIARATAVSVIANLTIPQGGLFRPATAPDAAYLIESNPAFTDAKRFISSDYYFRQIGVNLQTTAKRLGDGMYEQQLVRDQITALTGKAVLGPFTDIESMYQALMTSGAELAKSLNLSPGMSLSAAQVAALTSNVVIMQTQILDGQTVLVPVVYLAKTSQQPMNGPLIAAGDIDLKDTQTLTNSGTVQADRTLTVGGKSIDNAFGSLQSGSLMTLTTAGDIDMSSATVNAGSLALMAGGDLLLNTTTNTLRQDGDAGATRVTTTLGPVANLNVTGNAAIATGGNFEQNAGNLNVGGNLGMAIGGNWDLGAVQTGERKSVSIGSGVSDTDLNSKTGSTVTVGGVAQIGVGGDLTATGANLNLKGGGVLAAKGDVTLQASVATSTFHSSGADSASRGTDAEALRTSDDTVIGTTLQSGDSLTVVSGKDINVLGSGIALEKGTATLVAAGDVNIGEVTETHEFHSRQEDSSGGFLSSTTTVSMTDTKNTVANGSVISADSVAVAAGKDMSVRGSTIVGTKDVALQAGHDLRVESTENVSESRTFREEKRSGFGSSGGVGISYGKNEQRDRTNDSSVTQTGSLVGSVNGNVGMVAGNDLLVRGSDIVAGGNVAGIGKNVTVESAVNRQHHDETHETKSSGFTLAVKAPVIDAVQNVANQTRAAADSGGDARVSALRGYAAASGGVGAMGQAKGALDALANGGKPEAKVELSWGSSSSTSTASSDSAQNVSSNVTAGGTAAFIATGDAASGKGSVNIIGSNIDAKDVLLQANNQVNLSHSTDTESSRSENESKSGSVGVSYGTSGWGVSASLSKSNGDANSDSKFQNNTHINASQTAVIASGGDTNIVGANVNADKVIARVGGDLNIASVQDTSESSAHQQSVGGGMNLSMGGASGSANYMRGNASGNYAGVEEQSGIQAGGGGFDVGVMGNTDLKGAYIASTADPSKNRLTTATLTFSDIENHSEYSANSFGVGGGATVGNGGANERTTGNSSGKNTGGISPMLPQMESGSERATTRTGVSEGTITLTDEANQTQDLASLNRDTTDLNGTVTRTPDLQDLLNDQSRLMQAATAAGEAVARDIGTYADKKADEARKLAEKTDDPALKAQYLQEAKDWSDGGDYRATMHAAGGAIVAGLGGGNALGGAFGAGLTSKLGGALNELSNEIKNASPTGNADIDQALAQIVVTGMGTAVGAVAGGTSGAFTGFNTDRFNRQLHPTEEQKLKQLQQGKSPEEQYRLAAASCALVRCADGVPDGDPSKSVLHQLQMDGAEFTAEQNTLKRAGAFDGYTTIDSLNDNFDRFQISNRAVGAVQGVMGAATAVAAIGAGCSSVVACGAGAMIAGTSLDYSKAGITQLVHGDSVHTYGERALQSLGLDSQSAALTYVALSLGGAATASIIQTQAGKQVAAFNEAARLTYTTEKFGTQGLQLSAAVMQTPQAQAILNVYIAAGLKQDDAIRYTRNLISSGTTLPTNFDVAANTELIKIVPKGMYSGDVITKTSPYFMTRSEYESLSKLPADQIAARLGLPAEQAIRGSQLGFDVYSMSPLPETKPAAFSSQVAPVQQGAYSAPGGAQQILVPNRTQWTDPNANRIGEIKGLH
ncbi:hemagglutinin repeat-containing protein [Pandoraea soli]|uniref:tRNA nuclease CdiA-2 n=1 Tax=Pandoraea soli TaxID=2508293 RepID=A0ABY6W2Z2_9BURK|nr:hemagglutinin repeat-containing protein [Pandoraea soli]VVD93297.1 tRNA nuclease CdiA-2 [Pandoraea soli]